MNRNCTKICINIVGFAVLVAPPLAAGQSARVRLRREEAYRDPWWALSWARSGRSAGASRRRHLGCARRSFNRRVRGKTRPACIPMPTSYSYLVHSYSWPPCRAARHGARPCRHCTVPRRAVPDRAMGQAFGPRHGTWVVYPCRAAHGPRPFSPCRVCPWHDSHGTPEEEGTERR
jgi:hypothetical protein